MRKPTALVLSCVMAALAAACAGTRSYMKSAREATAIAAAPQPLERSLFSRDPQGQLSEERLQEILGSALELDLPARVGVLPVLTASDWRGPNPDYRNVPAGVAPFVKAITGSEHFTLVTEVMPIPSGALGMEALREIAARYRLRYVILYREVLHRRTRLNPVAWGYVTLVGALFLPGQEQTVSGYLEASLFDVKTGLLLFTARRTVHAQTSTNLWYQDDKLDDMAVRLAVKFAPSLAEDFRHDVYGFADAVAIENERRGIPIPGAPPPAPGPAAPLPEPTAGAVPAGARLRE